MAGWSLWRRVLAVAVSSGVFLAAGASSLVLTAIQVGDAQRVQVQRLDAAQQDAATLFGLYLDEETGIRGYLLGHEAVLLEPYRQGEQGAAAQEQALRRDLTGQPAALAAVARAHAAFEQWRRGYALPLLADITGGHTAGQATAPAVLHGKKLFDAVRASTSRLTREIASAQRGNERHISDLQVRLEALVTACLSAGLGALVLLVIVTRRSLVLPVRRLSRTARKVANGELRLGVAATGPQELVELATDFDAMRTRLLVEIDAARTAVEALKQNSPTVVALAEALQPHVDDHPALDVAAAIDPAEGLLAGDWCDVFRLDARLGIVVGDVSGHGPTSAVLALRLRSILLASLRLGATPGEALAAAARAMADDSHEHFATVFAAIIDPGRSELSHANAGHPDALVTQPSTPDHWAQLAPTGPLLSPVVATWSWATQRQAFTPATALLIFTDGVLEARNPSGDEYTLARLRRTAASLAPGNASAVVEGLQADVANFSAGAHRDDRTIVYCSHQSTSVRA